MSPSVHAFLQSLRTRSCQLLRITLTHTACDSHVYLLPVAGESTPDTGEECKQRRKAFSSALLSCT